MNVIYDAKRVWHNDTLSKLKNWAEYILIYIHYFVWCTELELNNEKAKKKKENIQQRVENIEFDNGQQYNNTSKTARTRQIKLLDESIDALTLFTLLVQVKYNIFLIVNVDKLPD